MKFLHSFFVAIFAAGFCFAQEVTSTTIVRTVTTQVVENVSIQQNTAVKKVAVFVQNRARVAGMDDEVDGVRDRLVASLAATDSIAVLDSTQIADSFRRWKITTNEEKAGLVDGIFTGGSVTRVAQMIGCDYIVAASIVGATSIKRNISGRQSTVYTLRMTLKVVDSTGASVFAMAPWSRQLPILEADQNDALSYYNMLFDQWSEDAGAAVANSANRWRKPTSVSAQLANVIITTTIDAPIAAYESQTKGVHGELLQELRKVVGGATISIDGAVIGAAPGQFKLAPGLHQLEIVRDWMKPYKATINVVEGMRLNVALEMTSEGLAKWGTEEKLRAEMAKSYTEAAWRRGIKLNVNLDTQNWRDVGVPRNGNDNVIINHQN